MTVMYRDLQLVHAVGPGSNISVSKLYARSQNMIKRTQFPSWRTNLGFVQLYRASGFEIRQKKKTITLDMVEEYIQIRKILSVAFEACPI